MPNLLQTSVVIGVLCTLALVIITVCRQKRFETSDIGSFLGVYFSGSNLPPATYLCFYVFVDDPALKQTKLDGYEKYIAGAGLLLLLASIVGVWKFLKTAWETPAEKTKATLETQPVMELKRQPQAQPQQTSQNPQPVPVYSGPRYQPPKKSRKRK